MQAKNRKQLLIKDDLGIYITKESDNSLEIVIEHNLTDSKKYDWQDVLLKRTDAMVHLRFRRNLSKP
jgi:hypothetical protein